jgi:hypothetical protein
VPENWRKRVRVEHAKAVKTKEIRLESTSASDQNLNFRRGLAQF